MEINIYLLIGTIVFIIDLLRALVIVQGDRAIWITFRGMLSIFFWPIFVGYRLGCLIGIVICLLIGSYLSPTGSILDSLHERGY